MGCDGRFIKTSEPKLVKTLSHLSTGAPSNSFSLTNREKLAMTSTVLEYGDWLLVTKLLTTVI